jgi:thiosulfate dehydrogenase
MTRNRGISPKLLSFTLAALLAMLGLLVALLFLFSRLLFGQAWPVDRHGGGQLLPLAKAQTADWQPPGTLPAGAAGELVRYGRELVTNTAQYLGPQGSVAQVTNGMNCQNCHLEAGTKHFGNNYSAVAATYPRYRARSGTVETVAKRVNDCVQRSLNGQALDSTGRELRAIRAYILWLGQGVEKGKRPKGVGLAELAYMDRAASPSNGQKIYLTKCQTCHQADGQGLAKPDGRGYVYPPLWGRHSYNNGAGLYRLSRFAGYVWANMPLGATAENPQLTEEEAWDVAAYVNSQPRPDVRQTIMAHDWPDLKGKPIDHPFGPFADPFSEKQHKFGPFGPLVKPN